MRRRKPFRSVWYRLAPPKADKKNKEGFPSFSGDVKTDTINVLMTGTTANTFYVRETELAMDYINLFNKVEPEFLAKATVYAREKGYKREIPIAATVALSARDTSLFRRIVHRVCLNPHDWQKFIDICRSKAIRRGLGRALKEEIIKAIGNMSAYHAMKYPQAVKDMIRIAHPRESVNAPVIRYIMRKDHSGDPQLRALYELKHTTNEKEIIRIIEEGRLPYEVVTGSVQKMTPAIWEALLYQAPYFNMIRNLLNYYRNGILKGENLEYVVNRISNPEAVRESKLFPFRFYVAAMMCRNLDREMKELLVSSLEKAAEIAVNNVPELKGRVAIATDISGSMKSPMTGDYSVVWCCDVAALFSAIMIKKCSTPPLLLPFNHELRVDVAERAMGKSRLFDIARALTVADGGTSLSAPVEYLIKNRIHVDYFIGITDNEEWVDRAFIDALRDYLKINPSVKVYLITLLPYRDYPTPTDYPNVHYVFGWSDAVLKYIASDTEKQMKEIEKLEI